MSVLRKILWAMALVASSIERVPSVATAQSTQSKGGVVVANEAALQDAFKKHKWVLVAFVKPQCPKCASLAKELQKSLLILATNSRIFHNPPPPLIVRYAAIRRRTRQACQTCCMLLANLILLLRCDVSQDPLLGERHNVTTVPSLKLFDAGEEIDTFRHQHLAVSVASFVTSHLLGLQHRLREKAPLVHKLRKLQQQRSAPQQPKQERGPAAEPAGCAPAAPGAEASCTAKEPDLQFADHETLDMHIENVKAKLRRTKDPEREPDASKIVTLTDETFEHHTWANPVVMVEFYAPWCGHCKELAPEYERAARSLEREGHAGVLAKVDASQHGRLAQK